MKIEISAIRNDNITESYPGQFEMFSHLEFISSVPQVLFAITTIKENGRPNVNFHSWSSFFSGDNGKFFVFTPLSKDTHTFENIEREREFCINFLSLKYYDNLINTVKNNAYDDDEFIKGGFNIIKSRMISPPIIKESFISLECKTHNIYKLNENGKTCLVIGEILYMFLDEEYTKGYDKKYTKEGYMFNIHSPLNINTYKFDKDSAASINVERLFG